MGYYTTYKDDEFQWNNQGQLTYILNQNLDEIEYHYDTSGIRRKKTVNGVETRFVTDGAKILAMKQGTNTITFRYVLNKLVGFLYNTVGSSKEYLYQRNIQGDIVGIFDDDGKEIGGYAYDAYGNHVITKDVDGIATLNPFRYRGYFYDEETGLYYLNARYYDSEVGRFINADDISNILPETIGGLNLYAYCLNNPVMMADPTGCAPWYSWLISGLQLVGGIALCFVPGGQGIGASLIIGGTLGLIANAAAPAIGQAIGGASSIANGWGAFSTGMSILGLGIPGLIGGIALMLVGGATMAFGANEVVAAATGTNYIQQWTGMSDTAYGWTYAGLNIASSLGQMAGNAYRLHQTRTPRLSHDGLNTKGYRYKDARGNFLYDFDYPHGNIKYNHYHGIPGGDLVNRTSGQHWSYLRLIWWLISGR